MTLRSATLRFILLIHIFITDPFAIYLILPSFSLRATLCLVQDSASLESGDVCTSALRAEDTYEIHFAISQYQFVTRMAFVCVCVYVCVTTKRKYKRFKPSSIDQAHDLIESAHRDDRRQTMCITPYATNN